MKKEDLKKAIQEAKRVEIIIDWSNEKVVEILEPGYNFIAMNIYDEELVNKLIKTIKQAIDNE